MKTSFYGDESFWGIGVVEDINDPLRAGRVKVRIYGLHSEDDGELPTSDLPWSQIAVDPTNAGISGLGKAPVGMVKGSLVHGKFLDGRSKQNFLVTGVIVGFTKRTKVQGELQGEPALIGNSNPEIIFNYLRSKGFQEIEATGIVAAMIEYLGEDIDPSKSYLNGRFGIGLWENNSLLAYREYALRKSSVVEDLETQLEFMVETLAARGWPNFLTKSGKSITPSTSAEAATAFIQLYYGLDTEKTKDAVKKKATEVEGAYGSSGARNNLPSRVPPAEISSGSYLTSAEEIGSLFRSQSRPITDLIVLDTNTYENSVVDISDFKEQSNLYIHRDGRIQIGLEFGNSRPIVKTKLSGTIPKIVANAILTAASVTSAPLNYLLTVARIESSVPFPYNHLAVSPTGAKGLFQFTSGTGEQYGLVKRVDGNIVEDLRFDPELNAIAGGELYADNRRMLQNSGYPTENSDVYLTHQIGFGSYRKIIEGGDTTDDKNLIEILRVNLDSENQHLKTRPKEFLAFWKAKYDAFEAKYGQIDVEESERVEQKNSIALSFVGGRQGHSSDKSLIRTSDSFTDAQWASFDIIVQLFLSSFPNSNILGLRDIIGFTTSPEFNVRDYVRSRKPQWVSASNPSNSQTIEIIPRADNDTDFGREALNPQKAPEEIFLSPVNAPEPDPDVFEDVTPTPIVITSTDTSSTVPSPFEDPITTIAGKQNPLSFDSLIPTTTIQLIAQTLFDQSILNYVQTSDLDDYLTINDALDADTLDGIDSTAFALLTGANNFTTRPSVDGVNVALVSDLAGGFDQSADYVMTGDWEFTGLLEVNSNKVWHEGNDGAGSGLDADTLDGFHASDFIQAGAGSDADTLDGEHGAYYLDWDNFTDLPAAFPPTLHDHDASNITSGVFDTARIPTLPYIPSAEKNSTNGVAGLDPQGKIYSNQLPAIAITTPHTVANISARNNLTVQEGDVAIVLDDGAGFTRSYIYDATDVWREMSSPGQVTSVAGKTGAISLVKSDVGLSNVDNTSDLAKPISTAAQTALNGKVGLSGDENISGVKTFATQVNVNSDLTFASERHRITTNDGGGNFQIRVGHDFGDSNSGAYTATEGGWTGLIQFSQSSGIWHIGPNSPISETQGSTFVQDLTNAISISPSTGLRFGGNTVWHAGNDGAGSGLDADTLDGFHASEIGQSPWTESAGELYYVGAIGVGDAITSPSRALHVRGSGTTVARLETTASSAGAYLEFLDASGRMGYVGNGSSSNRDIHLVVDSGDVHLNPSGNLLTNGQTVWHAGNDGAGSGLDADTLDGFHASDFVQTGGTSNADTFDSLDSTQFLRSDVNDTFTGSALSIEGDIIARGAGVTSYEFGTTSSSGASPLIEFYGARSVTSNEIAKLSFIDNFNSNTSVEISVDGDGNFDMATGRMLVSGNEVWHAGNDGAGSGLDADLLDGQQGSHYLDYNNLTNVPPNGAAGSDADLLDGQHGVYYLDYNNFTNTPAPVAQGSGNGFDADLLDGEHGSHYLDYNNFTNTPAPVAQGSGNGFDADTVDGVHASALVKYANTGSHTISTTGSLTLAANGGNFNLDASSADFVVRDTTNSTTNFIWRDRSADKLYFGTPNAVPTTREDIVTDGGDVYWHAGIDGSGSGLDADLLDGLEGSSFLRSDTAGTAAGEITFNNGIKIAGGLISNTTTSTRDKIRVWNSGIYTIGMQSNFTHGHLDDYAMTFQMNDDTNRGFWWGHDGHTQSQGAMSLTTDGRLWVDQSLTVAGNEVWHAGNDGAGSGLDADLLDGYFSDTAATANSVTIRNSAGDIAARLFRGTFPDETAINSSSAVLMRVNNGSNNYARYITGAGFVTWLGGYDGSGSGLDADLLDGQEGSYYLPASSYTAADVLAKIKTVDGSGSGLDADMVDGLSSASFIRADTSDNVSGHTEWQDNFSVRLGNGADTRFYHNGTHTYMDNYTGNFYIRDGGTRTLRFTFARTTGNFTATGDITAFSDESLKDNIRPYESFDISNLEVKRFERNDLEGKEDVGVIAQEVREYFPEAVIENEDGILSVNYAKLAVAAVAAQKTKMSAMQNEINELRQLINNLKK